MLSEVYLLSVKASEIFRLQFHAWYYTTDPEQLYDSQWTTNSGGNLNHAITLPSSSTVEYVILYMDGFLAGTTYNIVINDLKIASGSNLTLRQAYIQGSTNINIMDSFTGSPSAGYSSNFDVDWSTSATRIVLYYESTVPSNGSAVGITATLVNAIPVSYGTNGGDVGQIQQDTSGILGTLGNIWNKITDIASAILNIPVRIGDMIQNLYKPDPEVIEDIMEGVQEDLDGSLGFLSQARSMIKDYYDTMGNVQPEGSLYFPGIKVPYKEGNQTRYWIIAESQEVNIFEYEIVQLLLPWVKKAITFICIIAFLNMAIEQVESYLEGKWGH